MLNRLAATHKRVVTLEEGALRGGFGSAVRDAFAVRRSTAQVHAIGADDRLVPHGARSILLDGLGLSVNRLDKQIHTILERDGSAPDGAEPRRRRWMRLPTAAARRNRKHDT
jgi:1-deoxy-D-xylulose-5-phosphate synthase